MSRSNATPTVSICVPNLNTRPFLAERFETICRQTFPDWELLVYDSYSQDGAWEYIQELAAREPRMRAWQGPKEGTPGSWTPCIRQARGEYVYVATSDDTMAPDCLEKMVAALERHRECDLAHCRLRILDQEGKDAHDWWSSGSLFSRSSGSLFDRPHVRLAPYDGLLQLTGESVYISITQLLVRRSLFDRVGYFTSRWGSVGDFNWCMRASLVANTIHVPDTWGGWRVYAGQATAAAGLGSSEHYRRISEMIDDAVEMWMKAEIDRLPRELRSTWAARGRALRDLHWEVERRPKQVTRWPFLVKRLLAGSWAAREHLKFRLTRGATWPQSAPEFINGWLVAAGLGSALVPIPADTAAVTRPVLATST